MSTVRTDSTSRSAIWRLEAPALVARFYQELFQRDPALRPLFTTDMAEQKVKFTQQLTQIVWAIPRLDDLLSHTRALGARHAG